MTFGTPVVYNSSDTYYNSATYDSTNQKVVMLLKITLLKEQSSQELYLVIVQFGSPVVYETLMYSMRHSSNDRLVMPSWIEEIMTMENCYFSIPCQPISHQKTSSEFLMDPIQMVKLLQFN